MACVHVWLCTGTRPHAHWLHVPGKWLCELGLAPCAALSRRKGILKTLLVLPGQSARLAASCGCGGCVWPGGEGWAPWVTGLRTKCGMQPVGYPGGLRGALAPPGHTYTRLNGGSQGVWALVPYHSG